MFQKAKRWREFRFTALGLLLTSSSIAQQETDLKEVSVMGNRAGSAVGSSDAASQGSVTSEKIASRPTLRTGEILEVVPGLMVVQHSGGGKANQYFLRGFNLDHGTEFATFVDGVPVNMRTHAHGQGYTDLNFLIPELIQRVDYRKGPYYAEEGDFSSAGSARMRLFDKLPQGIAGFSRGTRNFARAVLANSAPLASGSVLYALELGYNDGPFTLPDRYRKVNGSLRYSEGSKDDGYSLTAMAYQSSWNATDQIPQRAVASGQIGRLGAVDTSTGGDTARYSLSYNMRKRNDGGKGLFEFNAFAVKSRLDLYSNLTYFLDDPVNGDQFAQRERRTMLGFNASQTWGGTLAGFDMSNRIGLQTRIDDLAPVVLESTVQRQFLSSVRSDTVRQASAGLFLENTTQWHDKFRSIAGLRLDSYRFSVASNIALNSGKTKGSITSPKLALVLGPWHDTEYFLSYGQGFHSNDARGTTATLNPRSLQPIERATPLVRSRGAEIGVRTDLVPKLQTSLALWRLDIGSELLFSGEVGETIASRPSRRKGIEWTNRYAMTRWLEIDLDVSLSQTRFSDTDPAGNRVPGSVDKVVSLGFNVPDYKGWSGSMHLRYFGPRVLIEDNSVLSQGTALINARLGYKIDRNIKIAMDIFNLFNRRLTDSDYYYASRLRGEAAAVNDVHFHPAEPRTLRLTLTKNF